MTSCCREHKILNALALASSQGTPELDLGSLLSWFRKGPEALIPGLKLGPEQGPGKSQSQLVCSATDSGASSKKPWHGWGRGAGSVGAGGGGRGSVGAGTGEGGEHAGASTGGGGRVRAETQNSPASWTDTSGFTSS